MLSITTPDRVRTCQGMTRRELLRVGSLALGGLSLQQMMAAKSQLRASTGRSLVKDKAVVFLFLQGGPSQFETFDPKMSAPADIRSVTGETQTALPGVTFGSHFEKMGHMAERLAVVRSFASGNGDHQNYMTVAGGDNPLKAPMGSLYARIAGPNNLHTGIPNNVLVTPEAALPGAKMSTNFETESLKKLIQSSQALGASYSFFDPSGGGEMRQNLQLRMPPERLTDRRNLMVQLDNFKRQADRTRAFDHVDTYSRQAYELLLRGVSEAFDLSKEDPRVLNRYATSNMFTLQDVHAWGDMRRSSNLLGHQMLLARRLVEAGCGYVTVMDAGWDMHSNGNSPKRMAGLHWLASQVDHAVSAFLEDIAQRGLSDKILLVITGEMGRTPKVNNNGGRDHWGNLTPLVLAGGGLKMGQVIGQSDRQGGAPASEKYTPKHLMGTIMQVLFDVAEVRLQSGLPTDVERSVTAGETIRELFYA